MTTNKTTPEVTDSYGDSFKQAIEFGLQIAKTAKGNLRLCGNLIPVAFLQDDERIIVCPIAENLDWNNPDHRERAFGMLRQAVNHVKPTLMSHVCDTWLRTPKPGVETTPEELARLRDEDEEKFFSMVDSTEAIHIYVENHYGHFMLQIPYTRKKKKGKTIIKFGKPDIPEGYMEEQVIRGRASHFMPRYKTVGTYNGNDVKTC